FLTPVVEARDRELLRAIRHDLARERRAGGARPDFEQGEGGIRPEGAQRLRETDGDAQVTRPVRGIRRLLRGEDGAGRRRDDGDARRRRIHAAHGFGEGGDDWLHHVGVKRVRREEELCYDAVFLQIVLQAFDRFFRAGDDAQGGTIGRGERDARRKSFL